VADVVAAQLTRLALSEQRRNPESDGSDGSDGSADFNAGAKVWPSA
jgi:hypothetical protein